MSISEKIDKFIEEEGKGDIRDALNIALARLETKEKELEIYKDLLKPTADLMSQYGEIE